MGLVAQAPSAQASSHASSSSAVACNISGAGPLHDGAAAALASLDPLAIGATPREKEEASTLSPLHLKDPLPSSKAKMESYLCPISHEVMTDPVVAMDG